MRVGIEWSGHAYDMSFLSGAKLTLSHVVDASALAAAVAWWGRLRAALLLAAPTPDALLQAWRDTSETLTHTLSLDLLPPRPASLQAARDEIAALRRQLRALQEAQRRADEPGEGGCVCGERRISTLPGCE